MPLFRQRGEGPGPQQPSEPAPAPRVLAEPDILNRLEEEIFRAERYGRPLVVLCVVAQRLPDQPLDQNEIATAAATASDRLRFCDQIGVLRDGTLVVILPETIGASARTVAHRIAADLVVRSASQRRRNWRAGVAQVPEDGTDPPTVVQTAIDRAMP